ncbi:lysophospholipase [Brucella sp. HL-2]|nr:lysophospholipase [Brucella sp. HL-2]MCV9910405.1 lysophospholipase [Brucella sp. HL-2]
MNRRASYILAALVTIFFHSSANSATNDPLPWNQVADKNVYPVSSGAVWAEYNGGRDCIRYFAAGAIASAPVTLIFLGGDRHLDAALDIKDIPNNTVAKQQAIADRVMRRTRLPVIIIARPGTYGSSGNHFHTRRIAEFQAIDATLNELKNKFHLKRFVILGHSGGATAGAALLTMGRRDISCAVLTSGAFSLVERDQFLDKKKGRVPRDKSDQRYAKLYDPLNHVAGIEPDQSRDILLIGNERDNITPFAFQRKFASSVRRAGHRVKLINHDAFAPAFHNLKSQIGLTKAAECARRI